MYNTYDPYDMYNTYDPYDIYNTYDAYDVYDTYDAYEYDIRRWSGSYFPEGDKVDRLTYLEHKDAIPVYFVEANIDKETYKQKDPHSTGLRFKVLHEIKHWQKS